MAACGSKHGECTGAFRDAHPSLGKKSRPQALTNILLVEMLQKAVLLSAELA